MKKLKANPNIPDKDKIGLKIVETTVPAKTVCELIESEGWDEADVLVIDTEGLDRDIVLDTIRNDLRFKIIQFEAIFVKLGEYSELLKTLAEAGYGTARSGKDIIAVHSTHPRSTS